jgi:hypothetical protein
MIKACAIAALLLTATPVHGQNVADRILPPEMYDRPYEGGLIFRRGADEAEMTILCPKTPAFGYPRLGCSYRWQGTCVVAMATDAMIRAAGHSPMIVLRHELGHCNGWPSTHEGARSLAEATPGVPVADAGHNPDAPFFAVLRWWISGR